MKKTTFFQIPAFEQEMKLYQLEQGGWIAVTYENPSMPKATVFAEDIDSLLQKLKVMLVTEKMDAT